jgi:hypothetical protein
MSPLQQKNANERVWVAILGKGMSLAFLFRGTFLDLSREHVELRQGADLGKKEMPTEQLSGL